MTQVAVGHVNSDARFKRLVRDLTRNSVLAHQHTYDVFRNWLGAMHAFAFAADHGFEQFREELDRYTKEEGAEFARLMNIYTEIAGDFLFHDILGALFMEIEVSSVAAGQFFTSWHVCLAMAKMTFDKASFDAALLTNGRVTVCDPACGSGAQLLAFAYVVKEELGPAALRKVEFYGQDIDIRCVQMARIQLRFNGLDNMGRMLRAITDGGHYEPDEANRPTERGDDDQPAREESESVCPDTERPAGDPERGPQGVHEASVVVAAGDHSPTQATFEFY